MLGLSGGLLHCSGRHVGGSALVPSASAKPAHQFHVQPWHNIVPNVTQQCFRAGNRACGPDFGRIRIGKASASALRPVAIWLKPFWPKPFWLKQLCTFERPSQASGMVGGARQQGLTSSIMTTSLEWLRGGSNFCLEWCWWCLWHCNLNELLWFE